jgi:hypothetical protein
VSRRVLIITIVAGLAVAAAFGSLIFLSGRASAGSGGFGYGPGMMRGSHGFGPGMMGRGSGHGPGMMGGYYTAGSTRASATLVIRHQRAHCHTWSLNGDSFKAQQHLELKPGATLRVINYDVMPHRLVKLVGPAVTMRNGTTMRMMSRYVSRDPGLMNHMGATTKVIFSKPGTYRFRTRAGQDYRQGIQTSGADNVLTLTVTVR